MMRPSSMATKNQVITSAAAPSPMPVRSITYEAPHATNVHSTATLRRIATQ